MVKSFVIVLSGLNNGEIIFTYLDKNAIFQKVCENVNCEQFTLYNKNKKVVDKCFNDEKYYIGNNEGKLLKISDNSLVFSDEPINYRNVYIIVPKNQDFRYNDIRGRSFIMVNDTPLINFLGTDLSQPVLSIIPVNNNVIDTNDYSYLVEKQKIEETEIKNEQKNNKLSKIILVWVIILLILAIIMIIVLAVYYFKYFLPYYKSKTITTTIVEDTNPLVL